MKFYLEQDNFIRDKGYGKQTSSKKRNELNPVYEETFTFEDVPTLNNMILWAKVMDDDIGFDDKIGDGKVNLEKLKPDAEGKEVEIVVDPKKGGGWFSKKAKMFLKISYTD